MPALRRAVAPLAVLLLLLVGGEGADVLPCPDADCGLWGWVLGADGHDEGAPGAPAESADTACLCHTVYVSPARVPAAVAHAAPARRPHAAPSAPVTAGWARVPVPPPRA